jgi:hypothetical protein
MSGARGTKPFDRWLDVEFHQKNGLHMRMLVAVIMIMSIAPQIAVAQTGSAPFCLKRTTGQLDCTFPTMGECEQARPSVSSDQCITRSDAAGTTGLGDRPVSPQGSPGSQSPSPER